MQKNAGGGEDSGQIDNRDNITGLSAGERCDSLLSASEYDKRTEFNHTEKRQASGFSAVVTWYGSYIFPRRSIVPGDAPGVTKRFIFATIRVLCRSVLVLLSLW